MGLYTNFDAAQELHDVEANFNMQEFQEACFYDEHYSDSDDEKRALLEEADVLLEAKKISRKTIVRLNKNDDLTRRTGMAALQLAKDNNDGLWKKLVKNRIMERKLLAAIKKKYANKAQIAARKGQRAYVTTGGATGSNNVPKMHPKEMSKTRK
jgi:hypothetical protein